MRFKEIIEGLQIFAKYEKGGLETFLGGAEHDVILAWPAEVENSEDDLVDSRISSDDAERLKELGWFISREYDNYWATFV